MYENIITEINTQNWSMAEYELKKYLNPANTNKKIFINDTLCILAATIYQHMQNEEEAFYWITEGLKYNIKNYELYLLLGNYYENKNIAQAWLCYENAEFYCSNDEDFAIISEFKNNIKAALKKPIPKISIIILSYNKLEMTKACIESIRKNNLPSSYDLIVVDNASDDGSKEWLEKQDDIKLICNKENMGFPYGCNQGIEISNSETDIFLLNNDTIVAPGSVFWLRMGLYSGNYVGATGSVSNRVSNDQNVDGCGNTLESCMEYAIFHNVPMKYPYEEKSYLIGFALMIKRDAINVTGLLDTRFSPGTYEDNDYCIRLHNAGWKVLLCKNSFIYHDKQVQANSKLWRSLYTINLNKFTEKWNFNIDYYSYVNTNIINLIKASEHSKIKVLEIGCGLGMTLSKIQSLWHNSDLYGIEANPEVAKITSKYLNVIQGNAETMEISFTPGTFDYIILTDILVNIINPCDLLRRFMPYLKPDGMYLCSVPNLMHTSVLFPLLFEGKFNYQDSGILDKAHLRFFTLESIVALFNSCDLAIKNFLGVPLVNEEDEQKLTKLESLLDLPSKQQFITYQYVFSAKKK